MRGLVEFLERKDVRIIVEQAARESSIQGVVAEYEPLFLAARFLDDDAWLGWTHWIMNFGRIGWTPDGWTGPLSPRPSLGQPDGIARDRWRRVSSGEPIRLRICLRPQDPDKDSFPSLDVGNVPFKVVYEHRPLAQLVAAEDDVGFSIAAGRERGTLGGLVRSKRGDWLGLTCSHVVGGSPTVGIEQSGQGWMQRILSAVSGQVPNPVGVCILQSTLVELAPGQPCNPYGVQDRSNEIDAAFIRADFAPTGGRRLVGGPARRVSASSGQATKMLAIDGARTAQIGPLAAYYVLHHGAREYCFGGLFEVTAPPYTAKVVHPGDSGAWIMRHGATGDEWLGVVVGSDDLRGFAMFAEPIYDWGRSAGLLE